MPKVSVIIPCYNLGKYIEEAVDSVLNQTYKDFEIIIVNDGSTEKETVDLLNSLNKPKTKVLHTNNQGLAEARNNGIKLAVGEYILPLDADDRIAPTYLEKAVLILDENKNVGIVYSLAEFFDEENSAWDLPEYSLPRMLLTNLIFCSAFFRKTDWDQVGGYKASMKYGWEDYEFWLSLIELKREVYRIPEHLFFYRSRHNSMANAMSREHLLYSHKEIVRNHSDLFIKNIEFIFENIYSMKDNMLQKERERIDKDTHIHNLNLEMLHLNSEIAGLNSEIAGLNSIIAVKNSQLSNIKPLIRSLYQVTKKRIRARIGF
jgi:glycosyltransferase involved in cell wall biosynthesis